MNELNCDHMIETWMCANLQSPMVEMLQHPEQWVRARTKIKESGGRLMVYAQNVLATEETATAYKIGGNYWEALINAGILTCGLPLAVEGGAVKEWSATDRDAGIRNANAVLDRIEASGGRLLNWCMDEPLTAGLEYLHWPIEETANETARFVIAIRPRVHDIELIEYYDGESGQAAMIVRFMELVQQAGGSPTALHLDIDRIAIDHLIKAKKLNEQRFGEELRHMQFQCKAWGIPLRIVMWQQNLKKSEDWRMGVERWRTRLKSLLPDPDALIFQCWEQDGQTITWPKLVPETEHETMTAAVAA